MPPIEIHWSLQAGHPILGVLLALPALTSCGMLALRHAKWLARGALVSALVETGLALELYYRFDPKLPAFQFAEWYDLPGPLDYHVGAAGADPSLLLASALALLLFVSAGFRRWNGTQFAGLFAVQAIAVFLIVVQTGAG